MEVTATTTTTTTITNKSKEELAYQRILKTRKRSYEKHKVKHREYVKNYFQNVIKADKERYDLYKKKKCEQYKKRKELSNT